MVSKMVVKYRYFLCSTLIPIFCVTLCMMRAVTNQLKKMLNLLKTLLIAADSVRSDSDVTL